MVFLAFLLLAVQLIYGMYARTTITAVGTDVAADAARDAADGWDGGDVARAQAEVRRRLGDLGRTASVEIALVDDDGDGVADAVRVVIAAPLPRFLPSALLGDAGTVTRAARARLERGPGADTP